VSVWYGQGFHLYDALARPDDAPRQSLFVLVPLVMTGLGGVLSNILFGPFATVGYWVCGFGDAVGEPVGSRWGRHSYGVPSMAGVSAERTLEGSLAVLVASSVAAWVGLMALGVELFLGASVALLIGLVGAGVEAISTHGLDNLTTQLSAAGLAYLFFGF
jgi:phytol kinase